MNVETERLADNIQAVKNRLRQAARQAGTGEVHLVAVTKNVTAAAIGEALKLGLVTFGENRVQEALPKLEKYPEADWHFIGRLQTNKVKDVVGRFNLIQSLDRWRLAEALEAQAAGQDIIVRTLVQVNVAGETQKGGLDPVELDDFLEAVAGLSHIRVEGLMTIPPLLNNPEETRPYFRRLADLFHNCRVSGVQMRYLSMGMSGDYGVAVEEGANMVRVGSAIFGTRY